MSTYWIESRELHPWACPLSFVNGEHHLINDYGIPYTSLNWINAICVELYWVIVLKLRAESLQNIYWITMQNWVSYPLLNPLLLLLRRGFGSTEGALDPIEGCTLGWSSWNLSAVSQVFGHWFGSTEGSSVGLSVTLSFYFLERICHALDSMAVGTHDMVIYQ